MPQHVQLNFDSRNNQVQSLKKITREIGLGRAKIIAVDVDPKDTTLLTLTIQGVNNDS